VSNAVSEAVFTLLSGDNTLVSYLASPPSGYPASIFESMAPQGASSPYISFGQYTGNPDYTLKVKVRDSYLYRIIATVQGPERSMKDATQIAERVEQLLFDADLAVSGKTLMMCRKYVDLTNDDIVEGVLHFYAGALYRIEVT